MDAPTTQVSTHSRPKAAADALPQNKEIYPGFNTQPPEGGWSDVEILESIFSVSTHSRPKAAGCKCARAKSITKSFQHTAARRRLPITTTCCGWLSSFNTQPPEGGWDIEYCRVEGTMVSTHSRPKAAGPPTVRAACMSLFQHTAARRRLLAAYTPCLFRTGLFQHTAARRRLIPSQRLHQPHRGFNTQPPEGGWIGLRREVDFRDGFNTQPPEGGWRMRGLGQSPKSLFQHTAARRRLGFQIRSEVFRYGFNTQPPEGGWAAFTLNLPCQTVSTHSRPKAAGRSTSMPVSGRGCFNTQPPEGGWVAVEQTARILSVSTHSRPKAAGLERLGVRGVPKVSTHSRPKAAGDGIGRQAVSGEVSTHSRPKAAGQTNIAGMRPNL